jgi:hypothetical protein
MKANGTLTGSTKFTAVGYGGQERSFEGQGHRFFAFNYAREYAVSSFNETNVIAGVTITGDSPCTSTNVIYRLATA